MVLSAYCKGKACHLNWLKIEIVCNEYGTFYAISSDFGDRMTTQHLD